MDEHVSVRDGERIVQAMGVGEARDPGHRGMVAYAVPGTGQANMGRVD